VDERLFSGAPIGQAFDLQRKKAEDRVAELSREELRTEDLERLEAELVELYQIRPLELRWGAKTAPPRDRRIEVERDGAGVVSGRTHSVSVGDAEITFFLPYSGMDGLFDLRPTRHDGTPPRGFVWSGRRLLRYSVVPAELATVQRDLDRLEAAIKRWAARVNRDVDAFNSDLPGVIHRALQKLKSRLDLLRAQDDLVSALGVPRTPLEEPRTAVEMPRHPGPARNGAIGEANGGESTTPAVQEPVSGQRRGPGRPAWTRELFDEHLREAIEATHEPRTIPALAAHFRALDGTIGVSGEHLGRLCRRKEFSG
jgi:hypothetical protein